MTDNLKPSLIPASESDKETVQNMARFYVYDMSRYCGELPGWEMPENGLYECRNLTPYFTEKTRFPFLIRVGSELAGFVLINKVGTLPEVDWNVGEFFVIAKFQGQGVARQIAFEVFDRFPGIWEVTQMPKNEPAVKFWKKIVEEYSSNPPDVSTKVIQEPKPHPMIVIRFHSRTDKRVPQN